MGILFRLLAPKPVKKIRHAAHPVRNVKRAVTPKPVRQVRRAAHPVSMVERGIENGIVHAVRGSGGRTAARRAGGTGTVYYGTCGVHHRRPDTAANCKDCAAVDALQAARAAAAEAARVEATRRAAAESARAEAARVRREVILADHKRAAETNRKQHATARTSSWKTWATPR
ncbi:hypothetical protein F7Q99_27825 [Streptomyces kaniharaensis]|uniref:Uncharacterized protein n=1 Tax=Streptomyces kaniharaensis TaxID=212423 RepID=A0A6N7KZH8_9ACTN|nr:hypothetical protein [Streptomyces kaniharaensis]